MKCKLFYCSCESCQELVSHKKLWELIKDNYPSSKPECLNCNDTGIAIVYGGSPRPCHCSEKYDG